MKDSNNNPISFYYEFEDTNAKTKILEKFHWWIIINKKMSKLLSENKTMQYFCDTTYKCIPPTFNKFKLFVISGYNFIGNKIYIVCFCLIPNEKQKTKNL